MAPPAKLNLMANPKPSKAIAKAGMQKKDDDEKDDSEDEQVPEMQVKQKKGRMKASTKTKNKIKSTSPVFLVL
jgi:hypothetical protein